MASDAGPHMVTVDCGWVLVTAEEYVLYTLGLSQRSLLVSCLLCLPGLFIITLPGGDCFLVSAVAWARLFFFFQTPGQDFRLIADRAPDGNL